MDPRLSNKLILLRRFTLLDATLVQALAGDRAVADTTLNIPHPYPDGAAEQWIATHDSQFGQATGAVFAVTTRPDLVLVGCIGIRIDRSRDEGEIGYWIGRPFWGRGYGTAALQVFLPYCFGHLGLQRVQARHLKRNLASGRVIEKAGMRRERAFREHNAKSGSEEDMVMYGLLRDEVSLTKQCS